MTLENAWKAAARHWHAEVVRLRALNSGLSQANREAHTGIATRRERETYLQDALIKRNMRIEDLERRLDGVLRDAFTTVREPNELSADLEALSARIAEADRKHPRDIADGMPLEEDASVYLERARALLNRRSTWLRALMCEVAEARYELVIGNTDRLADELLDVATVALRWRRAILERTKTGE